MLRKLSNEEFFLTKKNITLFFDKHENDGIVKILKTSKHSYEILKIFRKIIRENNVLQCSKICKIKDD